MSREIHDVSAPTAQNLDLKVEAPPPALEAIRDILASRELIAQEPAAHDQGISLGTGHKPK